jgi:antirestriction protein ArdC
VCVYYTSGDRREGEKDTLSEYVDKMSSEREMKERERERENKQECVPIVELFSSVISEQARSLSTHNCTEYIYADRRQTRSRLNPHLVASLLFR